MKSQKASQVGAARRLNLKTLNHSKDIDGNYDR